MTKSCLMDWIVEALEDNDGAMHHVRIAEFIWRRHEAELRESGDLFYTWQYDLRWAATKLRERGLLDEVVNRREGVWRLATNPAVQRPRG